MKGFLIAASLALAVIFMMRGSSLGKELEINRAMLAAQHDIAQSKSDAACPALTLTNGGEPGNARQSYSDARLEQIHGLYLLAEQDGQGAARVLENAPHTTSVDAFWLGCAEYAAGEIPQSINAWHEADAGDYFVHLGYNTLISKGAASALPLYQLAAQIAPHSADAWLGLAQDELDLATAGKFSWSEVLASAGRAKALAPTNPQAHYLLGFALFGSHADLTRAEQELRLAWNETGDWLAGYVLAGVLLDSGKRGEPTVLMEQIIKQQDNPNVRTLLIRAYVADGRCADAVQAVNSARAKFPQFKINLTDFCKNGQPCNCAAN